MKLLPSALAGFTRTAATSSSIGVVVAESTSAFAATGERFATPSVSSLRAGEVDVAPGAGFRLETELRIDARELFARLPVRGIVEDGVVQQRRRPAQVACRLRFGRARLHRVLSAHRLDIAFRGGLRRQLVQVCGVRVVPAEIALVDRLRIMAHRAVIAAVVPLLRQHVGQLQHFRDLARDEAGVHQPDRLVVQEFVGVAMVREESHDLFRAEARNAMRGKHHVAFPREEADRFRQVIRPGLRIAHQRAARGQQIVHAEVRVLRHEDRAVIRQKEVHLGGGFRSRRDLEHHPHIAHGQFLSRMRDVDGRRDQRGRAHGGPRPEARGRLAAAAMLQRQPELVARAAQHRRPRDDVFRHRFLQEARGRDHGDLADRDIRRIRHAAHARIMVCMGMRIDDGDDGLVAEVFRHEFVGRARRLDACQRVDHDPAVPCVDEGHRRDAEAAHLVDAVPHLEEPVLRQDLRLLERKLGFTVSSVFSSSR